MRYKTKLTIMDSRTGLRTGAWVPQTGLYRVRHLQHTLPQEVTLLKDQMFPRCSQCGEPVFFEFVGSAGSAHPSGFNVALYELPELLIDKLAS